MVSNPEGTFQMRTSHSLDPVRVIFDDEHLVGDAGLIQTATLAQQLSLLGLFTEHEDLGDAPGRANDDCDALRAGATAAVLGPGLRAPSTLGSSCAPSAWR